MGASSSPLLGLYIELARNNTHESRGRALLSISILGRLCAAAGSALRGSLAIPLLHRSHLYLCPLAWIVWRCPRAPSLAHYAVTISHDRAVHDRAVHKAPPGW